ncbi:MAG: SCO family protein [Myxococcales bacterium]|nr:SCO family protein [Myxococcales bacterium]
MTRNLPSRLPVLSTLPDFRLTDENGQPFEKKQLAGKVWVASFIFTRCPTACPLLSAKMEKIQKRTRNLGRAFHLVSFSVDPENDTPAELHAYARRFHANPRGWTFVTGPLDAMQAAVVKGFKIAMVKEPIAAPEAADGGATGFFDIIHGEHLVLCDQQGRIRGYFEASDDGINALVAGIAQLVNGQ